MSLGVVVVLLCALPCFASFGAASCTHGTCDGTTRARKHAGVMLQKVSATQRIATSEDGPNDGQYIKMSTRVADMESRVSTLEEVSTQGRESLKTQLTDLTTAVDTMQSSGVGSLDDTTSRVSSSEGSLSTLEQTADTTNAGLRGGVEALTEEYEALAKNVGEAFSSLSALQTGASQEPAESAAAATTAAPITAPVAAPAPATAATPAAAGSSLTGRTTNLEARVATLESASGEEREALKVEIVALDKRVDGIRAGGPASLEHTTSRVGSAEKRISDLHAGVAKSSDSVRAHLASLRASVEELSAKVGSGAAAMLQTAGVQVPAKPLPLTNRITNLEQRIAALEDKSSKERGSLQLQLDAVSGKVEDINAGGVSSLDHTTLRQSSAETDTTALEIFMAEQKATLEAETAALKVSLDDVRARVGASLLEAD